MKSRIVWLALSGLIVAALVLASCAPAPVEEKKEEGYTIVTKGEEVTAPEEAAPAAPAAPAEEKPAAAEEAGPEMVVDSLGRLVEKPQYGGSLGLRVSSYGMQDLDPATAREHIMTPMLYDRMLTADWTRGPTGTNEVAFNYGWYDLGWTVGELVDHFEIQDLQTIMCYMRQDVYWQDVPPVSGRKFDAYDVNYTYIRRKTTPTDNWYSDPEVQASWVETKKEEDPAKWAAWEDRIEGLLGDLVPVPEGYDSLAQFYGGTVVAPLDKYTVIRLSYEPNINLWEGLTFLYIWPHEMWETYGSLSPLEAQCGTGPFMMTDYIPDSSATFVRNPNHWRFDPFHPENRLPYIQEVRCLLIEDDSTYYAALRSHKIDIASVAWNKAAGLWASNPELLYAKTVPSSSAVTHMRTDIPPFSDVRVRRAAMYAIDQYGINKDYYQGLAYMLTWPVQPAFPELYTPIEDLPEEDRMLYEYHPDLAEQLLDEAGYPRGADGWRFHTTLTTLPYPSYTEPSLMIKEYLAKVGIDVEVVVPDQATAVSILYGRQFEHMFYLAGWGNDRPTDAADCTEGGWLSSPYNFSNVVDDVTYETMQKYYKTVDPVERAAMLKAQYQRCIGLVYELHLPTPGGYIFWAPWIKGYNGEVCLGNAIGFGIGTLIQYPWIDQNLKYQITGSR